MRFIDLAKFMAETNADETLKGMPILAEISLKATKLEYGLHYFFNGSIFTGG